MKILIALDDTESSHDAVAFTNELFDLKQRGQATTHEVMVLHVTRSVLPFAFVADPFTGGIVYPSALPAVMEAQAEADEKEKTEIKATAGELDGRPKVIVEHGDIGRTICEVVEANDIDLLVVGTRDHGAWSKLWHRSVSEYVVRHAGCAVLVVR